MIIPKPKYKINDKLWTCWFDKVAEVVVGDVEFVYNYEYKTKSVVYYCMRDEIWLDINEEDLFKSKEEVDT